MTTASNTLMRSAAYENLQEALANNESIFETTFTPSIDVHEDVEEQEDCYLEMVQDPIVNNGFAFTSNDPRHYSFASRMVSKRSFAWGALI